MTAPRLSVFVNTGGFTGAPGALLEEAVRRTVSGEGGDQGEISVTLLGDAAIQELNRSYLGKDRPTDVISFSLGGPDGLLGDIYVGLPQAERQAGEADVPFDEEVVRLAIHGTLHVLGYDHPDGPERADCPMYVRQEAYLRELMPEGKGHLV